MRVHISPACCDLCGEEGMTTPDGNRAQWRGATMYHSDPEICRANIERREREQAARLAELQRQLDDVAVAEASW